MRGHLETVVLNPEYRFGFDTKYARSRTRLSDFTFTFYFHALEKKMATHSSVLAQKTPGQGNLVGCRLWGLTESDTTEVT